eukprot:jgi/Botrbrau1/5942/Bobra.0366s0112.2
MEALIATYGARLGACLLAALNVDDLTIPGFALGLVNEVMAVISLVEYRQPIRSMLWGNSQEDGESHAPDWDSIVDALNLSWDQIQEITELYGTSSYTMNNIMADRRSALDRASTETRQLQVGDHLAITTLNHLSSLAGRQGDLHNTLVMTLERCSHLVTSLREQILRKILNPLQAATVIVACSPQRPDVLALLTAVNKVHGVRRSPPPSTNLRPFLRTTQSLPARGGSLPESSQLLSEELHAREVLQADRVRSEKRHAAYRAPEPVFELDQRAHRHPSHASSALVTSGESRGEISDMIDRHNAAKSLRSKAAPDARASHPTAAYPRGEHWESNQPTTPPLPYTSNGTAHKSSAQDSLQGRAKQEGRSCSRTSSSSSSSTLLPTFSNASDINSFAPHTPVPVCTRGEDRFSSALAAQTARTSAGRSTGVPPLDDGFQPLETQEKWRFSSHYLQTDGTGGQDAATPLGRPWDACERTARAHYRPSERYDMIEAEHGSGSGISHYSKARHDMMEAAMNAGGVPYSSIHRPEMVEAGRGLPGFSEPLRGRHSMPDGGSRMKTHMGLGMGRDMPLMDLGGSGMSQTPILDRHLQLRNERYQSLCENSRASSVLLHHEQPEWYQPLDLQKTSPRSRTTTAREASNSPSGRDMARWSFR